MMAGENCKTESEAQTMLKMIVLLSFGPGLFWLWYFYKKDKLEPEPKGMIVQMFFLGLLMAFPISIMESVLAWLTSGIVLVYYKDRTLLFLNMAVIAPIIEEYGKYCVVRHTVYKHREFNEPMDGIVYAATVALGFASIENLCYVAFAYSSAMEASGRETAIGALATVSVMRAFLSVPAHVLFSAMWGYALGIAKFTSDARRAARLVRGGLLLSMLFHAIFNSVAQSGVLLCMLIFMLGAWRMVHKRIALALQESPLAAPESEYEGNHSANCGHDGDGTDKGERVRFLHGTMVGTGVLGARRRLNGICGQVECRGEAGYGRM